MYPNPKTLFPRQWPRALTVCAALLIALLAATVLSACSGRTLRQSSVADAPPPPSITQLMPIAPVLVEPPAPLPAPPLPPPDPVPRVLAYAERVRSMPAAELSQETARLNGPTEFAIPTSQLQLALVLSQARQLPDLIRAQELLSKVLANNNTDAQALHPLARLLAFRLGEQRRLEDQLEKERQQTREAQKKLDQTTERLEALKAIERSLTTRPPAASPAATTPSPSPPPAAPASTTRKRASAP